MKHIISTLLLIASISLSQAQVIGPLVFSYQVTPNGTTTTVDVFVQHNAGGSEGMVAFTVVAYYDNTESTLTGTDASSLTWGAIDISSTAISIRDNSANIPTGHTGFGEFNISDATGTGSSFGTTPTKVLTLTFDNTTGTPAASDIYLASSNQGHSS